jgi:hypothetical protein
MQVNLTPLQVQLVHQSLERYTRTVAGEVARTKKADEKLNHKLKAVMELEELFKNHRLLK